MSQSLADVDLRHEDVVVNGVRVHTVEAGPPAGPLVICLHGFPEFCFITCTETCL